jgi:excisionase family DNA binding protein
VNATALQLLLDEVAERVAQRVAALVQGSDRGGGSEAQAWRLLTLEEVAERLGRSPRWVRDQVKAGELARIRLDGGAFAFDLEDVQAFARARRLPSDSVPPVRLVELRARR